MKACNHKWHHKGCKGDECIQCWEWNLKCAFDNPYCPTKVKEQVIMTLLAVVLAAILFLLFG
jgi:hypothetical protein